ncbi:MAG: ATP-binding protein [Thaumarchaeota archaeon]|nr:ATP-binding protein [Nitrososphaerota archaeon]
MESGGEGRRRTRGAVAKNPSEQITDHNNAIAGANYEEDYEELWMRSGFSKNPYDYRPLQATAEGREIFVGRKSEQEQFKMLAAGSEGGIVIVEGPTGVGKTSFVNAMLYDKWNPEKVKKKKESKKSYSYLPSFEIIQLQKDTEISALLLSALSSFIFALETIHGEKVSNSDRDLRNGKELVATTVRSGLGGFNLQLLGSGGGVEKKETVVQPSAPIPLPTIIHTMSKWFDKVTEKFGYEAGIVAINNMDVLPDKVVIDFLNSSRDLLLSVRHVWWILIAGPGLFATLETTAPRVSELVNGKPVILEAMSLEDVKLAIKTRIGKFRKDKSTVQPIPDEIVDLLYDASSGEIRYIFKRLTDVVYEFRPKYPSVRQIPKDVAIQLAYVLAKQKFDSKNLTQRESDVLKQMVSAKSFRIKDYKKFGYKTPQALDYIVSKFLGRKLLRRLEKKHREVVYSTTGDVNLVFQFQNNAKEDTLIR